MIFDHRTKKADGSSNSQSSSDDGYLTPEEEKIRALESTVNELKGRLVRTESSFGVNTLKTNLTRVAEDIGLPPEIHKRVMDGIAKDIQVWSNNHSKGDPTAMSALTQLQGENASGFIKTMIMNKLEASDLDEIARHRALRKQQNTRRFETDGPLDMATTGQEPPPDYSQFKSAADAARWARDNPGRHDSY